MVLKTSMLALALVFAVGSVSATAKDAGKTLTPQQQRMTDCNKQAAGKAGEERKAFMSSCLKGETAASTSRQTQQEKMKTCNADANGKKLKGADRKTFMSTCLRGDGAAAPAH